MAKDETTISNSVYEINRAAKHMKVKPWVIHFAKHCINSNNREAVYQWIIANEKRNMTVSFYFQD